MRPLCKCRQPLYLVQARPLGCRIKSYVCAPGQTSQKHPAYCAPLFCSMTTRVPHSAGQPRSKLLLLIHWSKPLRQTCTRTRPLTKAHIQTQTSSILTGTTSGMLLATKGGSCQELYLAFIPCLVHPFYSLSLKQAVEGTVTCTFAFAGTLMKPNQTPSLCLASRCKKFRLCLAMRCLLSVLACHETDLDSLTLCTADVSGRTAVTSGRHFWTSVLTG